MTPRDATWGAPGGVHAASGARMRTSGRPTAREAVRDTRWARLSVAVATSRGGDHRVNEDAHSAPDQAAALFVVADGVGGGAQAARASRELVSRLHATLDAAAPDPATVRAALLTADRAIGRSIATRTRASGAATVALCKGAGTGLSRWLVAWVGDCRVYRMRRAQRDAQLLTLDDTYRHLDEKPPPGGSPDDPARMVGNGAVDRPNVRCVSLGAGDMLVLCSDGVHKHAGAGDIARLLSGRAPLARRCLQLIDFARHGGSQDDATVLVVQRGERGIVRLARLAVGVALVALVAAAAMWAGDAGAASLPAAAPEASNARGGERP